MGRGCRHPATSSTFVRDDLCCRTAVRGVLPGQCPCLVLGFPPVSGPCGTVVAKLGAPQGAVAGRQSRGLKFTADESTELGAVPNDPVSELVHLSATDVSRRNAPQFSQSRCFPDTGFGAKSTARETRGDLRGS